MTSWRGPDRTDKWWVILLIVAVVALLMWAAMSQPQPASAQVATNTPICVSTCVPYATATMLPLTTNTPIPNAPTQITPVLGTPVYWGPRAYLPLVAKGSKP